MEFEDWHPQDTVSREYFWGKPERLTKQFNWGIPVGKFKLIYRQSIIFIIQLPMVAVQPRVSYQITFDGVRLNQMT